MYFYVDLYNLPDHPRWSDKWFTPDFGGANVFIKNMTYCAPGENRIVYTGPVIEKGEYCLCVIAYATSNLWNFRVVYLTIKVL